MVPLKGCRYYSTRLTSTFSESGHKLTNSANRIVSENSPSSPSKESLVLPLSSLALCHHCDADSHVNLHTGVNTPNLSGAAVSFNVTEIEPVINEIEQDIANIEKLAPIVLARISSGEQEDTQKEMTAAGLVNVLAERNVQRTWRTGANGFYF
jgi:hypothetical protein